MNVAPIMNSIQYARHQNQQRQHLWGILQRRLRAAVFSAVESVIAFILGFVMRFLEDYRVRAAIHHIYRTPAGSAPCINRASIFVKAGTRDGKANKNTAKRALTGTMQAATVA